MVGEDYIRELQSIDDPIEVDEIKVAMKCGPTDYHFIRQIGILWYNKSGNMSGIYIDQNLVTRNTWVPIWSENSQMKTVEPGDPNYIEYDDDPIYYALKRGWDAQ